MSVSFNAALNAYNKAAKMNTASSLNTAGGDDNAIAALGSTFSNTVSQTANALRTAEKVSTLALTKQADLTDVVSAITKAELTLRTVIEVRDRLINAHQDILKMPI